MCLILFNIIGNDIPQKGVTHLEPISILWPGTAATGPADFSLCGEDLQLVELAALIFPGRPGGKALTFAEGYLTTDAETISYRQDCLRDLLATPALTEALEQSAGLMSQMQLAVAGIRENPQGFTSSSVISGFKETLEKLERLFGSKSNMIEESDLDNYYAQLFRATIFSFRLSQAYVTLLITLRDALHQVRNPAGAVRALGAWVDALCEADAVEKSREILAQLQNSWTGVGGFSVDILVDRSLHVTGMELSSVSSAPYARAGVVTVRAGEPFDGIAALAEFPLGGATARFQECVMSELGSALRDELFALRGAVSNIPVSGVRALLELEEEFSFYTGAARFLEKLRAMGLPVAAPGHSEDCFIHARGAYPAALALVHGELPAKNDVLLPRGGTVNFVTGANSSGKTTWLIAAGQLQFLYQLGCLLPCEEAQMHPVTGLYTLFASGESLTGEDSRMSMEAQKLSQFRDKLTPDTMVLLNEPMTSTNAGEGIEICMDLLYELMEKQVSAMMVTHYNEIYTMLRTRLSGSDMQDLLKSYVMEIDLLDGITHYPYRLRLREPDRSSHAHEIVSQVGVTLEAMLGRFQAAGLSVYPDDPAWKSLHATETEV